jgi:hypothetical protein
LQSPVTLNLTVCFFDEDVYEAASATCVVASKPKTVTADMAKVFMGISPKLLKYIQ